MKYRTMVSNDKLSFSFRSKLSLQDSLAYLKQHLNQEYSVWRIDKRIKSFHFSTFEQREGTYDFAYTINAGNIKIIAHGYISSENSVTEIKGAFGQPKYDFALVLLPYILLTLLAIPLNGNIIPFLTSIPLSIFFLVAIKKDHEHLVKQAVKKIASLEYIY